MKRFTKMKVLGISTFVLLGAITMSCEDKPKESDHSNAVHLSEFKTFVSDLKNKDKAEIKDEWEEIEKEYEKSVNEIDAKAEELSEESRATYNELKHEYKALKNGETKNQTSIGNTSDLYEVLLTDEGDMKLNAVDAVNLRGVYKGFADVVENHKKDYSREDWDEVDLLWDALNKKKNELEDNVSTEDKLNIAKSKTRYGTMKTTYKMSAKIKEKSDK